MDIRNLSPGDVPELARGLSALPLMVRYGRTEAALARDLERSFEKGETILVGQGAHGLDGLAWCLPRGGFGLGGYLKLLAVLPHVQRKGVGSRLLEAYESQVLQSSKHAFLLVSDFNTPAQSFYRYHGYGEVGRLSRLVLPDVDEIIMHKKLT